MMREFRDELLYLGLLTLTLCAYCLPWVVHRGASLTFSGYDLAEWSSLNPAVRSTSPPLLLTFALRLLAVLTCLLYELWPLSGRVWAWLRIGVALFVAIALLPPFEFFGSNLDDPNHQQQAALALLLLGLSVPIVSQHFRRWHHYYQIGIILAGIVVSVVAPIASRTLMTDLQMPASLGLGSIVFVACLAVTWRAVAMKRGNFKQVTS